MKSVPGTLFFKPMKEEPWVDPDGTVFFPWATFFANGLVHTWDRNGVGGENWDANDYPGENKYLQALARTPYKNPSPYRPGEKCYVRETWRNTPFGVDRSPVTMPQWAARRFVTILSCEPIKVSEVTEEDAERLGVVAEWDSLSANQQENLKEKYMRDAIGEDDLFYLLWRKRHPGKEWAWRIESNLIAE